MLKRDVPMTRDEAEALMTLLEDVSVPSLFDLTWRVGETFGMSEDYIATVADPNKTNPNGN